MTSYDNYGPEKFKANFLQVVDSGSLRTFNTGATRDTSATKLDPFGFISPLALHRFSEYMHKHRLQSDGKLRDSDNWKKGMPAMEYVRSLIRHVFDFWLVTSGLQPRFDPKVSDPQEIACAILFNVQGFLHETLQPKLTYTQEVKKEYASEWERKMEAARKASQSQAGFGPFIQLNTVPGIDPSLDREVEEAFRRIA